MTEQEWLAFPGPMLMLEFLNGNISRRKRLLFAVACCRRVIHLMKDERSLNALELAERMADEPVPEETWLDAYGAASIAVHDAASQQNDPIVRATHYHAAAAAAHCVYGACDMASTDATKALRSEAQGRHDGTSATAVTKDRLEQANILRDIVGNPFRPSPPLKASADIVGLAQAIYELRSFARLPELASRLEEAGFTDPELLGHLRAAGPHAKGCWALDAVLGRQ